MSEPGRQIVDTSALGPLVLYGVMVVMLAALMLGLSYVLGERHVASSTGEPYESGILPTGSARVPFSARFYLVALLFLIFDLEAAFLFAWAPVASKLSWPGYIGAAVFVFILIVALLYEWRLGALNLRA